MKGVKIDLTDWIRLSVKSRYSVKLIAKAIGISPKRLSRKFYKTFGMYPSDWLEYARWQRAVPLTVSKTHSIKEVAVMLGYTNISAFCRAFRKKYGLTPKQFRRTYLYIRHRHKCGRLNSLMDNNPVGFSFDA